MHVILSQAMLLQKRRAIKRQAIRRSMWKGLNVVIAITMVANVGSLQSLWAARIANAAVSQTTGTITVQKQFDTNGDGVADITSNSPQLDGWDFTVDTTPSAPVTKTTSGGTGFLSFDVANGTFSVTETSYPTGSHVATASCMAGNTAVGTLDLANFAVTGIPIQSNTVACTFLNAVDTAAIHGQKFNDLNGNGQWDEPAVSQLGGWSIFLDVNNNGVYDAGVDQMTTTNNVHAPNQYNANDDYGWYHFDNLPYGTYRVCEVQQSGWYQTFPATANGCHTVSILQPKTGDTCTPAAPQDPYNLVCDFGNRQQASVTVMKNVDTDGNGTIDKTNATDWTWNINAGNQKYATGSTQYVTPGALTIKEDQKSGYHFTSLVCTENRQGMTVTQAEQATLTTVSGMAYVCTYTNTRNTGTIELKKVWLGTAGTATLSIGTTVGGSDAATTTVSTNGTTGTKTVNTGTYYFSETGSLTNYTSTLVCTDNGTVTTPGANNALVLATGHAIICTYTNTKKNTVITVDKQGPASVTAGSQVAYTIKWTVNGTVDGSNAVLTDVVPANTSFVSADNGGTLSGSTVTWNLGSKAVGTSGTVTVNLKLASPMTNGTVVTNTATFDTDQTDPVSDAVATTVTSAPQLSITKTNNAGTFAKPGATVKYTVVVTNVASATDAATAVSMTDTLPAGFTFVVGGKSVKTFTLGTLAPGTSVTTTYSVKISSKQKSGTYLNTATAKGGNTDEVTATAGVTVKSPLVLGAAAPVLTLTKSVAPLSVVAGKQVTYTMVIKNTGAGDAIKVVLTDTLPAGFTFTDTGKTTKVWNIATLTPGASKTVTALVTVASSVKTGTYVNNATVISSGTDLVKASASVTVSTQQVLGLATTGITARDYMIFSFGVILMSLGFVSLAERRRKVVDVTHE